MKGFGGLSNHDLVTKVICCGANGVATFQGINTRVATQLREKSSTFCSHAHCVVHKTNVTTFTLSDLPIVVKIEALLVGVYAYSNHSPKRNLERSKLVEIMEIKSFKNFVQHQNHMD
jgi:hypothetical protein